MVQEWQITNRLKHRNIVATKESFFGDGQLIMILEFCEYGDLNTQIEEKKDGLSVWTDVELYSVLLQITKGLEFAHANDVMHLDLKPGNIFVKEDNVLKIGDFGICKVVQVGRVKRKEVKDEKVARQGTVHYCSPGALKGHRESPSDDIWALGCILHELATR